MAGPERIWHAALWSAEGTAAVELRALASADSEDEAALAEQVAAAARFEGVVLDDTQLQAVRTALGGGVVVITGGPGTGKTTLVRVLVRAATERGQDWLLASPTGRAARRLEEATGRTASTVHRLLEFRPGEGGFQRSASRPLEADGLVVDEVSMVDLPLLEALVLALPDPPFSLVLVGDADQLPSVGPGQVLRDLIASGQVPVVRLQRVYRQGAESGILRAAATVLAGGVPLSGERSGHDDCFLIEREDPDRARETLLAVVGERLPARGYDPLHDIQVLAPTRKGPLGTQVLNQALQARLNPDGSRRGARRARVPRRRPRDLHPQPVRRRGLQR